MFGCVVAGRLLQTNLQQIDETHALFEIADAGSINHISVFLLGTVPFPEGFGATVHFHWPGKGFQLLGMLSNEKPSAIFRLRGTYTPNTTATHSAFTSSNSFQPNATNVTAVLGFSIEPLAQIQEQVTSLPSSSPATGTLAKPAADPTLLAERIVKNLFNYVSGFAENSSMGMGGGIQPGSRIEMAVIARWYEKFLGKVRNGGIGFLERDE